MNRGTAHQIADDCLSMLKNIAPDSQLSHELRRLLTTQLSKLELVSREDFEAQKLLLERTISMIDQLEQKIVALEQR